MIKPRAPIINWGKPITKGLVFDTPFFENGGNPVELITKRKNTLTSALWRNEIFGPVLNFNTASARVVTNYSAQNNQITHELYLYEINVGGGSNGRILEKAGGQYLLFDSAVDNGWELQDGQYATIGKWTITRPAANTWHHLVITYDGSAAGNVPKFYLNGVSKTVTTVTASASTFTANNGAYCIGNRASDAARQWGGYIAYCRIWNRILSASEAKQLHADPWHIYIRPNKNL